MSIERPGYGPAPLLAPLEYPGVLPADPGVLVLGDLVHPIDLDGWTVGERALDDVLDAHGAARLADRVPVAAVGSNASPAQVHRKFANAGLAAAVPITGATVEGVGAGLSAHVSRAGYIPAAPVLLAGRASSLHLTWLDAAGLAVMDATEPNYLRVRLPAGHAVRLPDGRPVPDVWIYRSRHGCVVDGAGGPCPLAAQREILARLAARLPELGVETPETWIEAARDGAWRDRAQRAMFAAGLARRQPELSAWPSR